MLTVGIRYLTGCAVASDVSDRRRVEWPPHPGRVFMALVAAHFQTGAEPAERAAIEWLESQPAPQIHAPGHVERPVVTHYVPVNDKAGPATAPIQSATGLTRTRQPRSFARAWLQDDTVYFVWPDGPVEPHFTALDQLCSKVTRIGHSSSLVQMWAWNTPPERPANWLPDENRATVQLRIPGKGVLHYLEAQFNQQRIEQFFELREAASDDSDPARQRTARTALREEFQNQAPVRLRPELSLSHGYAQRRETTEPTASSTVFDPRLLIFALRRVDGPVRHLDLTATLQLTNRFREALLTHLGASPEILSGHHGSARAEDPHVAYMPMPFVGREHAHGGILGIAVAVPRTIDIGNRQRLISGLSGICREGLRLGALGRWEVQPAGTSPETMTLRDRVWTAQPAGARCWATVTPYVFDRHPKARDKVAYYEELAQSVRESWHRVRLGSDVSVEVTITPVSAYAGAPASHEFPRLPRKDGSECRHTHVILIFDRPVVGPVILGAGRFRGYGLCRPFGREP